MCVCGGGGGIISLRMSLVTQRKRRGVHHRQFNSVVIQPYHQVLPGKTSLTFNVSANSVRFGRNPLFTIPNPALRMQSRCRPDKLLCEISATHRASLFVYNWPLYHDSTSQRKPAEIRAYVRLRST